ncbi:MAG: winged helix-turn-helix domain-containing protein [Candidatus Pacebacteria bacterium]|nr:winged helix-turn-helix domain-containing protein [Candidatus Paceibacterota bacterium]
MTADYKHHTSTWTFLTNHAHVLLCLVNNPAMVMRDIAQEVGITERAVQRIVADLRQEKYVTPHREGRRNTYEINTEKHLKHPIEEHRRIADLIKLIFEDEVPDKVFW